ncbi:phenylacetate--CoA ligase family protein [Nocardia sp. NPDC057455]|uniref:phenylacetate--CoA ligase family protein n=1 Tax=Nocardia sp. NPDC057455 TaxID=3346138 RepID=UPI0036704325
MGSDVVTDALADRPRYWHNQTLRTYAAVAEGWRMYDMVYRHTEWDLDRLTAVSDARLRELLALVAEHGTAEQRAALAETGANDDPQSVLGHLPVLRKADLIRRPHELRTGLLDSVDVLRARTSGTTGEPVVIEHGESHLINGVAMPMRVFHAYGLAPGFRTLRVTCDPRHDLAHFSGDAATWTRLRINIAKVTAANARYVEQLVADFRPDVVWGQPMEVLVLARMITAGELSIPDPGLLLTHGDTVDSQTRRALAATFDAPHRDIFGLQEFGQVAWECPAEAATYHVNEERVHIALDSDGALLLTNLINSAMLIVKYRPEDRAELLGRSCACGRALRRLRGLEGRQRGFIADRDGVPMNVKPLQLYLEALPLRRWQVRQTEPGRVEVLIVHDGSTIDFDTNRILAAMNLAEVAVRRVELEDLLTKGGKSLRFDLFVNQRNLARHLTEAR